jgi:hypothetical protein
VQSTGRAVRRVDWGQSAALLVRRDAAEQVGWMDAEFFVYSDEVDFQKRLADAGWHTLYVPAAVAVHHEQLSTGSLPRRRGSSSTPAAATATCASTTAPQRRVCRALAGGLDLRRARARRGRRCPATTRGATAPTRSRRCTRGAARACARRQRATTRARERG